MSRAEGLTRSPFSGDPNYHGGQRHIPILPSTTAPSNNFSQAEMMDASPTSTPTMGPPVNSSPEMEHENTSNLNININNGETTGITNGVGGGNLSAAAAASSQQPKVVQTAFIHKLYNMLEDRSIQNLISWSNSNESFVMSPSSDFSKVLAQYFKHTNISSFVRQLNMYGFHKVSDVFHTGSPESTLWEFKHGNGNFKRGDLNGLREIKRRASRHALIHRDSFSSPHKPSVSQPGTPAEPMPVDNEQNRFASLEHTVYDMHARMIRTEESNTALSQKCALLSDSLVRCHQWNHEMSQIMTAMCPNQETPIYRQLVTIQKDIARHLDMIRGIDESHESLLSGRQPYFSNMALDAPVSPRQVPQDDQGRRPSIHNLPPRASGAFFRPPQPSHINVSPRRYGSIGGASGIPSPSYHRPSITAPPPPQPQHPLATAYEPGANLVRRHTSADIRTMPGWPPQNQQQQQQQSGMGSPYQSGQSSGHWPSSPNHTPSQGDNEVRAQLASYELGRPRRPTAANINPFENGGRGHTPPLQHGDALPPSSLGPEANHWSFGAQNDRSSRETIKAFPRLLDSAPQTRRSSMASNVHSLLNPKETQERDEEAENGGPEERKRKRIG